jgi:acetoin utilization deacetylase AcuC-like enzyme
MSVGESSVQNHIMRSSGDQQRKDPLMTTPLTVFYSDDFIVENPPLETLEKPRLVAERILSDRAGTVQLVAPTPATRDELLRIHEAEWVDAIATGEPGDLANEVFSWSESYATSVFASTGAVRDAVLHALAHGAAGALSAGLHHARAEIGAGYCTFNGLALGALAGIDAGAATVGILDVDAHNGGGTFSILRSNPQVRFADVSVNSYDQWRSTDERHHRVTVDMADDYLEAVEKALAHLEGVDLVIHNAGMDPHEGCGTGGKHGINNAVLAEREALVAQWLQRTGTPAAFALSGGYRGSGLDLDGIIDLHMLTVDAFAGLGR